MLLKILKMKIKPCPFCKGTEIEVYHHFMDWCYVACQNPSCQATGPCVKTEEAALDKWNERKEKDEKA